MNTFRSLQAALAMPCAALCIGVLAVPQGGYPPTDNVCTSPVAPGSTTTCTVTIGGGGGFLQGGASVKITTSNPEAWSSLPQEVRFAPGQFVATYEAVVAPHAEPQDVSVTASASGRSRSALVRIVR